MKEIAFLRSELPTVTSSNKGNRISDEETIGDSEKERRL